MSRHALGVASALLCLVALSAPSATAGAQASADDQRAAREAYDHATAAYLRRDYRQAATLFETADRLAPAAAALVQAVRAHERAGNGLRAANLALRLQATYPDDRAAQRAARSALENASRWVRVEVSCEDCGVQLDGGLMSHSTFFIEAGEEHRVTGTFETGEVSETVSAAAGQTRRIELVAPEPSPVEPDPVGVEPIGPAPEASSSSETGEPGPVAASGSDGVPIWVSVAALVLTAGLGSVLIWSGVDTLDGVPAYEMNPTMEALLDGQAREERTNWLIGATAVAAAATLVLLILTDWSDGAESATATLDLGPDRAVLGVAGAF